MSGEAAAAAPRVEGADRPILGDLGRLARLAGPVVASRLGVMAMGLTDTIVVGRYSAQELGYLALGWAGSSAVLGSAMRLLSGVQGMASRALGWGLGVESGVQEMAARALAEVDPAAGGAALQRRAVCGLWCRLAATAE